MEKTVAHPNRRSPSAAAITSRFSKKSKIAKVLRHALSSFRHFSIGNDGYIKSMQIDGAFGALRLGAALVVILDSMDLGDKRPEWAFSTIRAAHPKWATKEAP